MIKEEENILDNDIRRRNRAKALIEGKEELIKENKRFYNLYRQIEKLDDLKYLDSIGINTEILFKLLINDIDKVVCTSCDNHTIANYNNNCAALCVNTDGYCNMFTKRIK